MYDSATLWSIDLLQQYIAQLAIRVECKIEMLIKSSIIIVLLIAAAGVAASIDFETCYQGVLNGSYGNTIGLDAYGHPVEDVSLAKGVNYTTCLHVCGSGVEPFDWSSFSQQFGAWLIPWLALVSQLPVSAGELLDNLMSVLLAIGSPALAAYSLVITLPNNRRLERRLANVRYPNVKHVNSVFSALQHVPLHLTTDGPLLPSLIILPQNDGWWSEMAERTEQTRNWNMPAAINIAWVFIALVFTISESVHDFKFVHSDRHAVTAVWLWLLPVVIGWLRVGSQTESGHLRRALRYCNGALAHVATDEGPQKAGRFFERRAINSGSDSERIRSDERREAPIFNYARVLFWSQATEYVIDSYRAASLKAAEHITVDSREWVESNHISHTIHDDNRSGNAEQVIRYCHHSCSPADERENLLWFDKPTIGRRWSLGVMERMAVAITLALFLQWCTTGAAVGIAFMTPTVGLGCRSMVYVTFGSVATVSFFSFVLSSLLAHACRPESAGDGLRHRSRNIHTLAIGFRWIGKTLATINAFGIIAGCIFEFGNVYNNCYCESSVTGLGEDNAFALLGLTGSDVINMGIHHIWMGGVGLALAATFSYGAFYVAAPSRR